MHYAVSTWYIIMLNDSTYLATYIYIYIYIYIHVYVAACLNGSHVSTTIFFVNIFSSECMYCIVRAVARSS